MINLYWRAGLLCLCVGYFAEAAWAQNPTIFFRPSGLSFSRECMGGPSHGEACTSAADCEFGAECQRVCVGGANDGEACEFLSQCQPDGSCAQRCFCNYVVDPPSQVVQAELRGRNWGPRLSNYQARIDFSEIIDRVHPFGWTCKTEIFCQSDDDCPEEVPVCRMNFCVCRNHDPSVLIDPSREDWVFFSRTDAFTSIDDGTPSIGLFAQVPSDPVSYAGTPKYLGTVNLFWESNACGDITIPLVPQPDTILFDNFNPIEPLDLETITLRLAPCICTTIVDRTSMPANCAVDARQDAEPDGTSPAGWSQVALLLDCEDTSRESRTRFNLRTVPSTTTGPPDTVKPNVNLEGPAPGWITLNFPSLLPGFWTCFKFTATSGTMSEVCLGLLPGDVDESGTSEAQDVAALEPCIRNNGLSAGAGAACDERLCDIDRSGLCAPADILREVDLLVGAEEYEPGWDGVSLAACPTTVAP